MKFDLSCSKHPKYQAKRYPRSACKACRILFWLANGGKAVVDYNDWDGFIHLETKRK